MKAMIEVEDEYNTDAIVEKIVDKKQIMIRGTVPGQVGVIYAKGWLNLGIRLSSSVLLIGYYRSLRVKL